MFRRRMVMVPVALAALVPLACGEARRSADRPPNIVLIIIDSLRADLLGCYGMPLATSPELDALSRRGVVFESALSQSSWTRPSIASMLTSLYPRTLGIYKEKYDPLLDDPVTLAELLSGSGYRTLGLTANPNINRAFNFQQGFDEYLESSAGWAWMGEGEGEKKKEEGLPRANDLYEEVLRRAVEDGSTPAYVQIDVMEVHSPRLIREEYEPLFDDLPVRERPSANRKSREALERLVRRTHAAVRQLSRDTARFVERLSSLPGWENTLFVITSDHGQGLDDHPDILMSTRHGNLLYESQTRVPLVLYNPGDPDLLAGRSPVRQRVRLLDVMPTILEYVGIDIPGEAMGESLVPLADGSGPPPALPEVFVTETQWRNVDKVAAYATDWKYIENRDNWPGVNEFELQPAATRENGSLTDRIENHAEEAARLKRALQDWEKRFPPATRNRSQRTPDEADLEQLRALGYLK